MDEHRSSACARSPVHMECLRPKLNGWLLGVILDHGRTRRVSEGKDRADVGLQRNGRVDVPPIRLAPASATDGDGCTALHAACIDLFLAKERVAEGISCDPVGVCKLLFAHGGATLVGVSAADGLTARAHCERHRKDSPELAAVFENLEEAEAESLS